MQDGIFSLIDKITYKCSLISTVYVREIGRSYKIIHLQIKKTVYFNNFFYKIIVLVLGHSTISLNHIHHPPGHALDQRLQVFRIRIFSSQSFLIASSSMGMLVLFCSLNCLFIKIQTFSMGLRSGEFPSHLIRMMWGLSWNHLVTILALWQEFMGITKSRNWAVGYM